MQDTRPVRRALAASFLLYVVFGLPDGVFGTVWPNLRDHFGRSDGSLGLVIVAMAVGYAAGGVASGHVAERFAMGTILPASMAVAVAATALLAAAPEWWVVLAGYLVLGAGWGVADAGVNTWMALTQGPRAMGMLHASYGVGAFLGPLLATAFVADGAGWRGPYVACTVFTVASVAALWRVRAGYAAARTTAEIAARGPDEGGSSRLRILMITWFSVYVGVEVAVGSWCYTLLTEARDHTDVAAGVLTAGYWGGLMAGRLLLAVVGHRIHPERTLRLSSTAAVVAVVVLWVDPGGHGGLALPVVGLTFSAMFPVAMGRTAVYVGEADTGRAVGYQIGATAIGFTLLPTLVGVSADRTDIGVMVPVVLVGVVALGILWWLIEQAAAPAA